MGEFPDEPLPQGPVEVVPAEPAPKRVVSKPSGSVFSTPPALEGVKSKRRAVAALGLAGLADLADAAAGSLPSCAAAASGSALLLGLGARASVAGLRQAAAAALLQQLAGGGDAAGDKLDVEVSLHEGLRVATVAAGGAPLSQQLAAAAASAPQLVCVDARCLRSSGGACVALKNFKGAVLVFEAEEADELDTGVLRALGLTSRWSLADGAIEPLPVLGALSTEVLGDLKLRDLLQNPEAAALVAAAQPLYDEYFHEQLLEDVAGWESSQVGFLVAREDGASEPEFCGLIVYKHWGAPLRCMSVLRVVVPHKYRMQGFGRVLMRWAIDKARKLPRAQCTRLTLCSMPEAIPFYERLQFTPIPQDDSEPVVQDESLPVAMPGSLWMELKCGRTVKPTARR